MMSISQTGYFSISKNGGRRQFGFWKFRNFNNRQGQDGQRVNGCQISWRSVKPLLRCGEFSNFQNGGRRTLVFFLNFEILMVRRVKMVNMHQGTKFRGSRSNCCWDIPNRCWDMAIFRFFQDGGHPPLWICCTIVWTTHEWYFVVYVTCKIWLESMQ